MGVLMKYRKIKYLIVWKSISLLALERWGGDRKRYSIFVFHFISLCCVVIILSLNMYLLSPTRRLASLFFLHTVSSKLRDKENMNCPYIVRERFKAGKISMCMWAHALRDTWSILILMELIGREESRMMLSFLLTYLFFLIFNFFYYNKEKRVKKWKLLL